MIKDAIRIGLSIYVFSILYALVMWFSIDPNIHWEVVKLASICLFFVIFFGIFLGVSSFRKSDYNKIQILNKQQKKNAYYFNMLLGLYIIIMNLVVNKTYVSYFNFFIAQIVFAVLIIGWSIYKYKKL